MKHAAAGGRDQGRGGFCEVFPLGDFRSCASEQTRPAPFQQRTKKSSGEWECRISSHPSGLQLNTERPCAGTKRAAGLRAFPMDPIFELAIGFPPKGVWQSFRSIAAAAARGDPRRTAETWPALAFDKDNGGTARHLAQYRGGGLRPLAERRSSCWPARRRDIRRRTAATSR